MGNLVFCTICGAPLDPADAIEINGKWCCDEHALESKVEMCHECGVYPAATKGGRCEGCIAYDEHRSPY
jgi:hypothetical protein